MGITVVVPTIPGRQQSLARALESVRAQSFPAAAIVVELDVDRTGAAATRNRAVERVDTAWTAFLDDDDQLYPDHLKLLARFARVSGVDVAYPGYDCTGEDPVNCFGIPFDGGLLRRRNFIPVTVLARTEAVRAAGGFQAHPDENGDPCEDWGLWLAMYGQGSKFGHLPVRTWRWNNAAESTRGRPDRW